MIPSAEMQVISYDLFTRPIQVLFWVNNQQVFLTFDGILLSSAEIIL